MPSKALCPDCGMKQRGPAHLCDPTKAERHGRRMKTLQKLEAKK